MACRPNKRQEAKERAKELKARYFVVCWLDDVSKYDTVNSKDIVPPVGSDVLHLKPGAHCSALFRGKEFGIEVVASGTYCDMKLVQAEKENEVLSSADDDETERSSPPPVNYSSLKRKDGDLEKQVTPRKANAKKPKEKDGHLEKPVTPRKANAKKPKEKDTAPVARKANKDNEVKSLGKGSTEKKDDGLEMSGSTKNSNAQKNGKCLQDGSSSCATRSPAEVGTTRKKLTKSPSKKLSVKGKCTSGLCEDGDAEKMVTAPASFKIPKTPTRSKAVKHMQWKASNLRVCDDDGPTSSELQPTPKRKKLIEKLSSSSDSEDDLTDHVSLYEAKRAANITQNAMFKQLIGLNNSTRFSETSLTADLAILKEKVRNLESTQGKLRRKVQDQDKEIKRLRRSSSFDMSSASESVTLDFDSPHFRKSTLSPPFEKPKFQHTERMQEEELPMFGNNKVDQLRLANAKLQSDAGSAALKLLDCLFATEELVNCNPSGNTKSNDPIRKETIAPLDPARMKYIYDFLESKWPGSSKDKSIRRKLTQKCTDSYNDPRFRHLRRGLQ